MNNILLSNPEYRRMKETVTIDRKDLMTIDHPHPNHTIVEEDIEMAIDQDRVSVQAGDTIIAQNIFTALLPYNSEIRDNDFVLRGTKEERQRRQDVYLITNINSRQRYGIMELTMENQEKVGGTTPF